MNNIDDYIDSLNQEYGLSLTGISPHHGANKLPKNAVKLIVNDFKNGLGRVIYVDKQNRLITDNMEPLIVGLAEAADMLGWSKQQVNVYLQRGKFPEPLQRLASGPIWTYKQIEDYKDSRS
ncbi:hypothetical protein D3C76_1207580 [compost metagenome]